MQMQVIIISITNIQIIYMQGYIKMHRKFLNWEWYKNLNVKVLFQHLLLKANYKDTTWQGIKIKQGSLITSIRSLATELGLSENKIRTALKNLKSSNDISVKTTRKYSLITITNWKHYQLEYQEFSCKFQVTKNNTQNNIYSSDDNAHQSSLLQDAKNKTTHSNTHKLTTAKENKNIRSNSNPPIIPPKKLGVNVDLWHEYLKLRKELKYNCNKRCIKLLITKLEKLKNEGHDVNQSIKNAIGGGWKSFYPPSQPNHKNQNYAHSPPKNNDLMGHENEHNIQIGTFNPNTNQFNNKK